MSHPVRIEIDEKGLLTADWWTPEIRELFCSLCPKKETAECDKVTCHVANPWCG